jgi:hypothetical protein
LRTPNRDFLSPSKQTPHQAATADPFLDTLRQPIGADVGRVIKIGGKLPVNFQIGAYYNALRPQYGSTWQLRTQVTLIF